MQLDETKVSHNLYFGTVQQQHQQITPLKIPTTVMGREHEEQVRSWGFGHVFTWSDGPYVS